MNINNTSTSILLLTFLVILTFISCSKVEEEISDPRDIFTGSYISTTNRICIDVDPFTTDISYGANSNQVIWSNILGLEGDQDDVIGVITNNTITIPSQSIGPIRFEAVGQLLPNGNIEIASEAERGVVTIWCEFDFLVSE